MQDLISLLGLGPASQHEPDSTSRTRRRPADADETHPANLSFDLLLAMAALPRTIEQPQPVNVDQAPDFTTWRGRVDLPEQAAPGEPNAVEATTGQEQPGAAVRELFGQVSGLFPEVETEAPGEPDPKLLMFGDGRRAQKTEILPTGGPEQVSMPEQQFSDTSAVEPAPDRAVSEAPSLTVVARNDQPIEASAAPVHLRVIHPDGSVSYPRPDIALIDRLANTWRHSFAADDVQIPDIARDQQAAVQDQDYSAISAGAAETDAHRVRLIDTRGEQQQGMGDEQGERPDAPMTRAEAARQSTVVPLFGDLMVAETPPFEALSDAPVSVRRAFVEIAGEASRLEQIGGSELSFTLKLAPEHLGQIEIDIQRVDNRWSVSITTAGDTAREALSAEIHRLERAFRDHNLSLDNVSVVTRGAETTLTAPSAANQAHTPNWFGGQAGHFGSNQNWDESGRRAGGRHETIEVDSRLDVGPEQDVTAGHARSPLSSIDIQA